MRDFKILSVKFPGNLTVLFIALSIISFFTACGKYDNSKAESAAPTIFVNAIPNASGVNLYLNGFRISQQSISFTYALPFFYVLPGVRRFNLTDAQGTVSIASDSVLFATGNYYSIFATEKTNIEFIVIQDAKSSLTDLPNGKTRVRFLNLSPDSPNIDLAIDGGATLFTNLEYKDHSGFINIDAGIYKMDFRATGNPAIKFVKPSMTLLSGKTYTIMAMGFWDPGPGTPGLEMGYVNVSDL